MATIQSNTSLLKDISVTSATEFKDHGQLRADFGSKISFRKNGLLIWLLMTFVKNWASFQKTNCFKDASIQKCQNVLSKSNIKKIYNWFLSKNLLPVDPFLQNSTNWGHFTIQNQLRKELEYSFSCEINSKRCKKKKGVHST